jgi:molybdopterin molybdotransferase
MLESLSLDQPVDLALESFLNENANIKLESEIINVEDSLSRILYEDILTKCDLPAADKALIDGYAVNSKDIADADVNNPVNLKIICEANVGDSNCFKVSAGEAAKISKGALMPENADAVVMPEDTLTAGKKVKVTASVINGCQVAKKGEDIKSGDIFILKQRKIRPQDIGGIIGQGYRQIKVFKKPVVTIIPTGNELVSIDIDPDTTQIISSNSYVLNGFVEQLGGIGKIASIVKDDLNLIKSAILKALEISDMVIVSGGSAIGSKDYTLRAIQKIEGSKIIAHSIAMKPGGYVLLAMVKGKPVIGLPGHPVSSLTCFHVFVKPVLRKLSGDPRSFWQIAKDTPKLEAILTKRIQSPEGKEDYVRVRLKELGNGKISAYPFTGRSSFLSTLVKSHGIIKIPADCTALYEGDVVDVLLF